MLESFPRLSYPFSVRVPVYVLLAYRPRENSNLRLEQTLANSR